MTKEKQIPTTLVSGLSDRLKLSLIKEMKLQSQSKVILYRDNSITYGDISKECFIPQHMITEVVYDNEVSTKKDLLSLLHELNNKEIHQIIIDLDKFSTIQLLFPYDSNLEENSFLYKQHIHIIDAVRFWFQYSSNDYIMSKSHNGEEADETSVGELLTSPLEMANVILLGNIDKINQERLDELKWFLSKLNPLAKLITMTNFKSASSLFGEADKVRKHTAHELYTYQLQLFEESKPLMVVGEYGIDNYIYRSTFPISIKHIENFLKELPEGTLRTKAICRSPLEKQIYYISQIGPSIEVFSEEHTYFEQLTSEFLSEFLFIGNHLDPVTIKNQLDNCLLKDDSLPSEELI
ncbi:GTP-binding protein [Evansella tamaricis]|uniref:GTP-binding protein n=1 Tax=Evansella tamaricis TaxID=2069301 RepID=A0ABS6JIE1_9BACI|nr:GTP-binding protein [Evansella tamaricis]MBU9713449.1 GTP-binding protein [Evansella tamaricis]